MNSPATLPTKQLLRLIGSPFVETETHLTIDDAVSTYEYATKNRVALFSLNKLQRYHDSSYLRQEYVRLSKGFEETLRVFAHASDILDAGGVEYGFFKSVRPYKEATVDLDILVFGDQHRTAVDALMDGGYKLAEDGGLSWTLYDEASRLNLDLYDEIGVSKIIYLDKDKFHGHTSRETLENGREVTSLDAKADLVSVLAHSVIKEQLYVLSEYFTTLGLVKRMNYQDVDDFVKLVKRCRIQNAMFVHLEITAFLHKEIHGFVPDSIKRIVSALQSRTSEISRLIRSGLSMPFRYSSMTFTKSLVEKFSESKARKSMVSQSLGLLNPRFSGKFFKNALNHVTRETY